jgi:wyosine [tRNA(Phe)-imidazoG37] synthetase (radical SAM superfamily)
MIAFGPVPSRRLGRSLGINNIPPKTCSYSCIYCQLGRTSSMAIERQQFYRPEEVVRSVRAKVDEAHKAGEAIDYLTFVADGEPTLDAKLGRHAELLRPLGIKIAVISNASLITAPDVQDDLSRADWVSLKMDSVRPETWRKVNRPHGKLDLASILESAVEFAGRFDGELATETMLAQGINDGSDELEELAAYLARLQPDISYLSVPIRPPAEDWVRAPREESINRGWQILSRRLERVEYLIGYEGDAFAFTGDVERDLLSITSVHPMREDAVDEFLAKAETDWGVVRRLIEESRLVETAYGGRKFYVRKLG